MKSIKKVKLGIIGCGYWGPNLVRNFSSLQDCEVKKICDQKPGRLEFIKNEFPLIEITENYHDILNDPDIDSVCIATPVSTHKTLIEKSLQKNKHVFVEKPMTSNIKDAEYVVSLSKKVNKKLAVGHVFQFAPAVRKMKELLEKKAIGNIFHITSTRINLGPPFSEVDVIWDLGPHDFSIILFLLDEKPKSVISSNFKYPLEANLNIDNRKKWLINNAHIDLIFRSGITSHIHLSWLSSNKTRLMQIFGSEGTIIYDEMLALDGKLKLLDKGIDSRIKAKETESKKLFYKSGDVHIIELEQHEPLRMECEEFINSVLYDKPLINDGSIGLEVVKLLEKSSKYKIKK
jgi:predicted dehydrogenase